ncbi:unnamed protein product [Darwinula stevensoni]|uniref:Uncharacterized protein n=1 Tax=Darwinula stevensoni TaxID=69355 RepID=A0A7R9AI45_9CRUS|nr:unnamed protein product [Darwinula stevensoni]CAG0906430.1 unnamed protein product [Darwinula stevensoni]
MTRGSSGEEKEKESAGGTAKDASKERSEEVGQSRPTPQSPNATVEMGKILSSAGIQIVSMGQIRPVHRA